MAVFGDIPQAYSDPETSVIVLIQVPYDETSTWIKGADRGPAAIIEASANLELYDNETGGEAYRKGIHTDDPLETPSEPALMVQAVERGIGRWLDRDKFVVTLGGEHSISLGAIKAHLKKWPDLSVLQLDAHADLREEYLGSGYNHACVMARARELCPVTQVGIRSMEAGELDKMEEGRVFFMEEMIKDTGWMDKVLDTLPHKVYLTLDVDVLDPSFMPSTGTPEPGGMDWYTLLALLRRVTLEKELVGFDVVELCPSAHNRAPDFLVAKLIYKILGYRFNTGKIKE